jgi:dienelactone hydrolase
VKPDAGDVPQIFARLGYVSAAINYRLASQSVCFQNGITPACETTVLDAQHDAQAAVRWLRANAGTYGIDPTRIAVVGGSAGAIIATTVGLHSEDVGSSGNPGFSSKPAAFVSFSGGLPSGTFASAGDSPGLFVHGTADASVPFQWAVDTTLAMLRNNVPAVLDILQGAGHTPSSYHDHFVDQTDYFLYDFMDLAHAAGQPAAVGRSSDAQARRFEKRHPGFGKLLKRLRR